MKADDGARGLRRTDVIAAAVLAVGTAAYVVAWPWYLGVADESYFLVESQRIANGERLYRDIYWIAMPGAHWVMALVFTVFGVDIGTAKSAMAVLHGLGAGIVYVVARRLDVRPPLAAIPALAYSALCVPAFHFATPHWFSTVLTLVLVERIVARRWADTVRDVVVVGVIAGALAAIHQSRGPMLGLAVIGVLLLDDRLGRRLGLPPDRVPPGRRLVALAAGGLLVLVPVVGTMLLTAGPSALVDQLIVHTLVNYTNVNRAGWGSVNPFLSTLASYTMPTLLRWMPLVLLGPAVRLAVALWHGAGSEHLRRLVSVAALASAAILSILYLPDVIHIAFIAILLFLLATETLETVLRRMERAGTPWPGRLVTGSLAVVLVMRLAANLERAHELHPVRRQTAFGTVAFGTPAEVVPLDHLQALRATTPGDELFVHPVYPSLYLLTGGRNPTRHSVTVPGYTTPAQYAEMVAALDASPPPVIAVMQLGSLDDPVLRWIDAHYAVADRCLGLNGTRWVLYRHAASAPAAGLDPHLMRPLTGLGERPRPLGSRA